MRILMAHPFMGEKLVYLDDIERHRSEGWVNKEAIAQTPEKVTITPQPEVKRSPGRPRREVPSILNDGDG